MAGTESAIEAPRLRHQAGKIRTLINEGRFLDAAAACETAEHELETAQAHLANLDVFLSDLTNVSQHRGLSQRLWTLQQTILHLEDAYAQLKSRFQAVSVTASENEDVDLWDLVVLDDAFGESLAEPGEVVIKARRVHALLGKAKAALGCARDDAAEDSLDDADKLIEGVEADIDGLGERVKEQERRLRVSRRLDPDRSGHGGSDLDEIVDSEGRGKSGSIGSSGSLPAPMERHTDGEKR